MRVCVSVYACVCVSMCARTSHSIPGSGGVSTKLMCSCLGGSRPGCSQLTPGPWAVRILVSSQPPRALAGGVAHPLSKGRLGAAGWGVGDGGTNPLKHAGCTRGTEEGSVTPHHSSCWGATQGPPCRYGVPLQIRGPLLIPDSPSDMGSPCRYAVPPADTRSPLHRQGPLAHTRSPLLIRGPPADRGSLGRFGLCGVPLKCSLTPLALRGCRTCFSHQVAPGGCWVRRKEGWSLGWHGPALVGTAQLRLQPLEEQRGAWD